MVGSLRRGLALQLVRQKQDAIAQDLQKMILLAEANRLLAEKTKKKIVALKQQLRAIKRRKKA